jgi:hypothetical protein
MNNFDGAQAPERRDRLKNLLLKITLARGEEPDFESESEESENEVRKILSTQTS